MSLIKQTVVDKNEVLEMGQLQIRVATKIIEDGKVISKSFQRFVLDPGADLAGQDAKTIAIATAVWDQDCLDAWNEFISKEEQ